MNVKSSSFFRISTFPSYPKDEILLTVPVFRLVPSRVPSSLETRPSRLINDLYHVRVSLASQKGKVDTFRTGTNEPARKVLCK